MFLSNHHRTHRHVMVSKFELAKSPKFAAAPADRCLSEIRGHQKEDAAIVLILFQDYFDKIYLTHLLHHNCQVGQPAIEQTRKPAELGKF